MAKSRNSKTDPATAGNNESFAASIKAMIPTIARDLMNSVVGPLNTAKIGQNQHQSVEPVLTEPLPTPSDKIPARSKPAEDESVQILKDLIRQLDL